MNSQNRNPVAALINKKNEVYIADLPALFGRSDNSVDVYFFHESISREHCLFECINRRVTIRDLGSTVGTSVNGVKLEPNVPYHIEDGAKITIGKVKFVFHVDYQEIAKRERIQTPIASGQPIPNALDNRTNDNNSTGNNSSGGRTNKTVTITARELTEYEYGEDEVVFIECGLKPESKPISFTSELKKTDVKEALNNESERVNKANDSLSEESKKTQEVRIDEIKEEGKSFEDESISETHEDNNDLSNNKITGVLHLSWIDDEIGKKKQLEIDQFPFSFGRKSDENDYAIRKKGVSRKHFHFEEQDGAYYVIDDKSTNGVKLNGVKIKSEKKTKLNSGDKLNVADITITIKIN